MASRVLYRKYRSQTFDELIGQSHITNLLKNAVKSDLLAHAYLFVGSRGTGKTSAARILSKAINCTNPTKDGNPCNECSACKAITDGNFLDLIEIDAASNRGIDQIRELKERIEFAPTEGQYKVYIIDEVHMLTKEAFNALLKTLEEPPSHVIFMLATTDVHKLPATILSRCQRYDFRLGSDKEVASVLKHTAESEGVELEEAAMELLVESASGSYRDALSLLDVVVSGQLSTDDPSEVTEAEVRQILGIPDTTMVYYLLEKLVKHDVKAALELIRELESKGVNLQQFVKYVLVMLRDILVKSATDTLDKQEYGFAVDLSQRQIIQLINGFLGVDRSLRNAHTPALMLEIFIVEQASDMQVGGNNSNQKENSNNNSDNSPKAPSDKSSDGNTDKDKDSEGKSDKKVAEKAKSESSKTGKKKKVTEEAVVNETNSEVNEDKTVEKEVQQEVGEVEKIPGDVTVKDIEEKWDDVVKAAQQFNGHLYAFLKTAQVTEIKDGTLILTVPFDFHKERIEDVKTVESVHKSMKDVFGYAMPVKCEVNAAAKRKKKSSADIVLKSLEQAKQVIDAPPKQDKEPAKDSSSETVVVRKVSKQVEAIFEGM